MKNILKKIRIDVLLTEKGLAESRHKAQALIMAGSVLVGGEVVDKPGKEVTPESVITIKKKLPYVGRGGIKLAGVLDGLSIDVEGLVIIDIGASTGGFTDCLLQRGALRVYAVDVGRGILDIKLRNDPHVRVLEGRNIRYMAFGEPGGIDEPADMAVIDVSFISLEKVIPKAGEFLKKPGGTVLALIKPQFEVGKGQVGKGGIVKDPEKHRMVMEKISKFSEEAGFEVISTRESVIKGAKGNREFWILLKT